jgi:hypothetical protein
LIFFHGLWGDRALGVHNIVVFTAGSVKEKYKHVKLLDLASLNGYIQWFGKELTASDVDRIASFLVDRCIKEPDAT